jgi:hypothetical protein
MHSATEGQPLQPQTAKPDRLSSENSKPKNPNQNSLKIKKKRGLFLA